MQFCKSVHKFLKASSWTHPKEIYVCCTFFSVLVV